MRINSRVISERLRIATESISSAASTQGMSPSIQSTLSKMRAIHTQLQLGPSVLHDSEISQLESKISSAMTRITTDEEKALEKITEHACLELNSILWEITAETNISLVEDNAIRNLARERLEALTLIGEEYGIANPSIADLVQEFIGAAEARLEDKPAEALEAIELFIDATWTDLSTGESLDQDYMSFVEDFLKRIALQ